MRLQHRAGNAAVQRALTGELPVQALRNYAAVPMTKAVGPGKMLKTPGDDWHYTITKAESPADAYTDEFHVTFERGTPEGDKAHFYFSDLGGYKSGMANTQQNQAFLNRKGGMARFPVLKAQADTHAAALLARPDFPAYEGSSIADIAAKKAQAAKDAAKVESDKAAAAAEAVADKAREAAGVKTLDIVMATGKARTKTAKFAAWLKSVAPAGTPLVKVVNPSKLSAVMTFADFAEAKAALPSLDGEVWNGSDVSASMPDA